MAPPKPDLGISTAAASKLNNLPPIFSAVEEPEDQFETSTIATTLLPPAPPTSISCTTNKRFWRIYRVSGKIIEAKALPKQDESHNYYCIARMDNQISSQSTSMAVSNTDSPFWAEEFQFDTKIGFRDVKFIVMMEKTNAGITHTPIGKVVVPRKMIKSGDEQTFLLFDASLEWKVTGSVLLQIKHFPPTASRKIHGFSVTVQRAKDLDKNGDNIPNPFAVIHLLPDPEAITSQQTHAIESTDSPKFKEVFFFTCSESSDPNTREINCALWSQEENGPEFLGHVTIPLAPVVAKGVVNRWYNLTCLENDSEFLSCRTRRKAEDEKKSKAAKELQKEDERRNKARDFVKSLHVSSGSGLSSGTFTVGERKHDLAEKSFVLSSCFVCGGTMIGAQCYCTECNVNVHQKCGETMAATCGAVGTIRIKMTHQKLIAFPKSSYESLIDLLQKDEYFLLNLLGKVSNLREEVAKCTIRVFGDSFPDFLKIIVRQEIIQSPDSKTLFRANSMASKALDVYMKHVGFEYLQGTIENVLKLFVMSKKGFEMDPLRLEGSTSSKDKRGKPIEETVEGNTANLIELNTIVTEHIFKSTPKFPKLLREIFALIQATVSEKFPEDELVRYTAVSGFLFLRFFAPAILGPHLFGLKVGVQDAQSSRKLLLIAKTLQNLSNFVEFGQKEPFMEPMNSFIQSRMPAMKKYIDEVSYPLPKENRANSVSTQYREEDVAQDCAELTQLLSLSLERLNSASTPPHPLVLELAPVLKTMEVQVKEIEELDHARNELYDMENDTGVDLIEDNAETPALNVDEETRILKTLSKIHSNLDEADSIVSSPHPGQYKNSSDIKDSLTKGQIHQVNLPFNFFSSNSNDDLRKKDEMSASVSSLAEKKADECEDFPDIPVVDGIHSSAAPFNPFAPAPGEAEFNPDSISSPPVSAVRRVSKQFFGNLLGTSESPVSTPNTKRRGSAIGMALGLSSSTENSHSPSSNANNQSSTPNTRRRGSAMGLALGLSSSTENSHNGTPSNISNPSSNPNQVKRRGSVMTAIANVFAPSAQNDTPGGNTADKIQEDSPAKYFPRNSETEHPSPLKSLFTPSKRGSNSSDSSSLSHRHSHHKKGSSLGQHNVTSDTLQQHDEKLESYLTGRPSEVSNKEKSNPSISSQTQLEKGSNADFSSETPAKINGDVKKSRSLELIKGSGDLVTQSLTKDQAVSKSKENISSGASSHQQPSSSSPSALRKFLVKGPSFKDALSDNSSGASSPAPSAKKSLFSRNTLKKKGEPTLSSRGSICPRCKLETDASDQVAIENLRFHSKCMTCATCKEVLSEAFTWKEDIYCRNDYYITAELHCGVCDLQIQKEFINVGGKKFHLDCKTCSLCKSVIGKDFAVFGNSIFCHNHKDCIPCFSCHKKIEGALVENNDRFYHPNHYVCFSCNKDLNGSVSYEFGDHPYCQGCYMDLDPSDLSEKGFKPLNNLILANKIASTSTPKQDMPGSARNSVTKSPQAARPKPAASRSKSIFSKLQM